MAHGWPPKDIEHEAHVRTSHFRDVDGSLLDKRLKWAWWKKDTCKGVCFTTHMRSFCDLVAVSTLKYLAPIAHQSGVNTEFSRTTQTRARSGSVLGVVEDILV